MTSWIFENHNFNAINLLFKNVITAGRLKCCGMEDRKVVAHGCWKTQKLILGMEGKNVVAYGCLPFPARRRTNFFSRLISPGAVITSLCLIDKSIWHLTQAFHFRYILDSVSLGKLVERDIYLLPAGNSTLLLEDVEQFKDYTKDLAMFECLLPSPPATSTRLSNKSKDTETISHKKILSGLNVLIISTNKEFTVDWQSVLVAMGATVHKRFSNSDRLSQIRTPDVVVADSVPPQPIFQVSILFFG